MITFAITVSTEINEIQKLLPFILEHRNPEDEVVVLWDSKNGLPSVSDYLKSLNVNKSLFYWYGYDFNGDFSDFKNKIIEISKGDYIFQIDADEMIDGDLIKSMGTLVEMNSGVELFVFPRINTVEGITDEHINQWGWRVTPEGWINFPDWQGRLYKRTLRWSGKVHERINEASNYTMLPTDEIYCIKHHKHIDRQIKQNNLYNTL